VWLKWPRDALVSTPPFIASSELKCSAAKSGRHCVRTMRNRRG
jgi:hypothetical protein